jgi:hypothetical protein
VSALLGVVSFRDGIELGNLRRDKLHREVWEKHPYYFVQELTGRLLHGLGRFAIDNARTELYVVLLDKSSSFVNASHDKISNLTNIHTC